MEEMDIIDRFLATFIAYVDSGFGLLAGDVGYLTSTLIVIDITLAGLFWALAQNHDLMASLIKKVLYVGAFAFIIGNFAFLSNVIFESFAGLGVKATGGEIEAGDLMRPGFVAGIGFEAAQPLLEEIGDLTGPIRFFHNFILIVVLFLGWVVILAAFFILAIQLFVTIIEFKLTTLAGFVLVPFALWNKTSFLAERVLGHVITSGIKLMVLAIVIGIGSTLFAAITDAFATPDRITLADVMGTMLGALVFLWMGIFAPGMASGLITGAPQLGAGSVVGTTAGVAAGGYVAAAGAGAAARGAASTTMSAVRAGASVTGSARTSYSMGRVPSGQSGIRGAAAGMGGVAMAAGGAMKRAASVPFRTIGEAHQRGADRAWRASGGHRTAPASDTPSSSDNSQAWARRFQTEQRVSQASGMAAHAVRDGDRGSAGAQPSLSTNDRDD